MSGGLGATDPARPLVSVVVPTFGRPEFLREAVESVLGQTYSHLELLVIDDCSPQPVALDDVRDDRLRVVRHPRNLGPGAARNTGLAHARGEFVVFLDDDDRLLPDRVERGVAEIGDAWFHAVRCNLNDLRYDGDLRSSFTHRQFPSVLQVMARRSDVVQFDPTLRVAEDIDWWLRMADRAVFAWSDVPGLWVRVHDAERPGVDPEVIFRCRRTVAIRHRRHLDRTGRGRQYTRVAACAMSAGRRFDVLRYSLRSLACRPTAHATKLLVRSFIPGRRWSRRRLLRPGT